MINKPAEEAFKTATTLTRLHAKLDVAKDAIACALDELPASFDEAQFKRINEIRNTLHQEMSRVFEFSKAEAKRICEQLQLPESSPAENRQLAGSADDWVTQDLVPDRLGIDQWRWMRQDGSSNGWKNTTVGPFLTHGFIDKDGDRFEVRCRRKDLPKLEQVLPKREYIHFWFPKAGAIYSNDIKMNPEDRELRFDKVGFYLD